MAALPLPAGSEPLLVPPHPKFRKVCRLEQGHDKMAMFLLFQGSKLSLGSQPGDSTTRARPAQAMRYMSITHSLAFQPAFEDERSLLGT